MRTADRRVPLGRGRWLAAAIAIGVFTVGCGGGAPSVAPVVTPAPTPAPTPVAHLTAPAKADAVFRAMVAGGLKIATNNASTGGPGHEPVKTINATYEGWPLAISEYSTPGSLMASVGWKSGSIPGQGEAPISIAGMNILIQWGPTTGAAPRRPDGAQMEAAEMLANALNELVSPLSLRTIVPIPGVTPDPTPAPTPSATAKATPKPTGKPKTTPKPTKKP